MGGAQTSKARDRPTCLRYTECSRLFFWVSWNRTKRSRPVQAMIGRVGWCTMLRTLPLVPLRMPLMRKVRKSTKASLPCASPTNAPLPLGAGARAVTIASPKSICCCGRGPALTSYSITLCFEVPTCPGPATSTLFSSSLLRNASEETCGLGRSPRKSGSGTFARNLSFCVSASHNASTRPSPPTAMVLICDVARMQLTGATTFQDVFSSKEAHESPISASLMRIVPP
mmetsp:Transcript_25738/g.43142  ORF Transcript_25738/g.43142 Transcript_25738/m.43142 type:complete len:228 (+) Transcript_25738:267-950(+)